MRLRTFYCALLLVSLPLVGSAVVAQTDVDLPRFSEAIYVVGDIPFVELVEFGEPVTIRFGIGELDIESSSAQEVRADLDVRCRPKLSDALCEKYRQRLRLEPHRTEEGIEVRLVGLPKYKMRKLELDGSVRVPRWSPLTVKVGIGDVDIRSDSENLVVDMGIGDLTVRAPAAAVGSVKVGTRIGDASLSRASGYIAGKRRMLIGAKVNWAQGEGDAAISVGLKIGDAKVVLE